MIVGPKIGWMKPKLNFIRWHNSLHNDRLRTCANLLLLSFEIFVKMIQRRKRHFENYQIWGHNIFLISKIFKIVNLLQFAKIVENIDQYTPSIAAFSKLEDDYQGSRKAGIVPIENQLWRDRATLKCLDLAAAYNENKVDVPGPTSPFFGGEYNSMHRHSLIQNSFFLLEIFGHFLFNVVRKLKHVFWTSSVSSQRAFATLNLSISTTKKF